MPVSCKVASVCTSTALYKIQAHNLLTQIAVLLFFFEEELFEQVRHAISFKVLPFSFSNPSRAQERMLNLSNCTDSQINPALRSTLACTAHSSTSDTSDWAKRFGALSTKFG